MIVYSSEDRVRIDEQFYSNDSQGCENKATLKVYDNMNEIQPLNDFVAYLFER